MATTTTDATVIALPMPASADPPDFSKEIRRSSDTWLGRRGIYRHQLPDVEAARRRAWLRGAPVSDVVSTVFGREWNGFGDCPASIVGELTRHVGPDGAISYSGIISRYDDGGDESAAALTISSLGDVCEIAKACAELRYEWAEMAVWRRG